RARAAGPLLRRRGHRSGLDPADLVAGGAGFRTGPAAVRAGHQRHGHRGGGLAVHRPARRLAGGVPEGPGPPGGPPPGSRHRVGRAGATVRSDRDRSPGRQERPAHPAGPAGPPGLAAAPPARRLPDRGAAAPVLRRGVRGHAARTLRSGAGFRRERPGGGGGFVMTVQNVVVHESDELLAAATAARLITKLVDVQAEHGVASLVLTGGSDGISVLKQVPLCPACEAVDWANVEISRGDERFPPEGDPERNETQARKALLDHVGVDPSRVHAMAPSDVKFGDDPDAAASHYAEVLAATAAEETEIPVPRFDVLLLGVGEEGHTASLFPDTPHVRETERMVVPVRDCPKPPPTRISLTLPAIQAASEVWLMTSGKAKAEAVASALGGADPVSI